MHIILHQSILETTLEQKKLIELKDLGH